jgi:hypothetical protein
MKREWIAPDMISLEVENGGIINVAETAYSTS